MKNSNPMNRTLCYSGLRAGGGWVGCSLLVLAGLVSIGQDAPVAPASGQPAAPGTVLSAPVQPTAKPDPSTSAGDKKLRLNFRGVPLEMVLNYLSEAAGFIIVLETELRGKVDLWSNQPVSQEEALSLLNGMLSKNGYAAIRNDRVLTIVSKEEAKKRDIPVKSGNNPELIPKDEQIVTQIVPVRFINAVQLIRDLQPLLPEKATMTANESGNALVITDTQMNIRRFTEIVRALDTSVSSISSIKVFPLRFADAKQLATVIKELFPATDSSRTGGGNAGGNRARFGGGFPGFGGAAAGGGDAGGGGATGSNGRPNASRVVATADERSNSLVVAAPDDVMPSVEDVVMSVDVSVDDVTELRVFRLKHADPLEMAELLTSLFPDDSRSGSTDQNRGPVRFGGFFGAGGGGAGRGAAANTDSDRMKKKGQVLAVADQRTSSVVVTAARELMTQIAQMVNELDSSPAKKQKVFVYSLENADVQQVEQILRGMFEKKTTSMNRNNTTQTSPLSTRSSNGQTTGVGTGSTSGGLGTGGGLGGNRGGN